MKRKPRPNRKVKPWRGLEEHYREQKQESEHVCEIKYTHAKKPVILK